MPPKMNQVWKVLQEKMSNKRTQQAAQARKGAKVMALSDVVVPRLTAEPDNKQTFRRVQPREFVEFSSDDLTRENLKIACVEHFGPSCKNISNTPPQREGKLK